jgi:hypothetical protein
MQGDREFQALPQYLLAFGKNYYPSHDSFKISMKTIGRKIAVWKSDHEDNFISIDLFFCRQK